jgi:hypothetical protein
MGVAQVVEPLSSNPSISKKKWMEAGECGSVVPCLPSMCKTLDSIPSTKKNGLNKSHGIQKFQKKHKKRNWKMNSLKGGRGRPS